MVQAYPLQWPKGWPRSEHRKFSRFKTSAGKAISDLLLELKRLRAKNIVISSNLTTYRKDGIDVPHAGQTHIDDPGVAVYFLKDGREQSIPCDKWKTPSDNMWAICKTIEALRGIERWGAKEMVDAAFRGFTALPAPEDVKSRTPREILGIAPDMMDIEYITFKYKQKAKELHPDTGGSNAAFKELGEAYDTLKRELE